MTTTTMLSTITCAGELRAGDMVVNPTWALNGVFCVKDVIECTDVHTEEESVIVVFPNEGPFVFGYDELVRVITD